MKIHRLIAFAAAAALAFPVTASAADNENAYRIVGYLPDWNYRPFSDIDLGKLTNINIAFCNPDENGELYCNIPAKTLEYIVAQAHERDVSVFAALGGGGGCDGYLQFLDTAEKRSAFNSNIMDYCERFGFDGIDLDIELGSDDPVWNYYGDWCCELRSLCNERNLQMSTATAGWVAEKVSPDTFALFDFVNVMAYDNDEDCDSHASYDYSVKCLDFFAENKHIPNEKLILGVPFYGRGYTPDGELDWDSYMSFADAVSRGEEFYNADVCDGVAYNGAVTMAAKAQLARNYGGIMIWELTQDARGDHSLLSVICNNLRPDSMTAGDVNADGDFNVADLVLLQRWLLNMPDSELPDCHAGDLCEDGRINAFDLCAMRRLLTNSESEDR